MRKSSVLITVSLLVLSFTLINSVAAETAYLSIHNGGNIWQIDTSTVTFDAEDINTTTLVPYYFDESFTRINITTIQKTTIKDGELLIFFYGVDIPKTAEATGVDGLLNDETAFLATGPGFAWGRR